MNSLTIDTGRSIMFGPKLSNFTWRVFVVSNLIVNMAVRRSDWKGEKWKFRDFAWKIVRLHSMYSYCHSVLLSWHKELVKSYTKLRFKSKYKLCESIPINHLWSMISCDSWRGFQVSSLAVGSCFWVLVFQQWNNLEINLIVHTN